MEFPCVGEMPHLALGMQWNMETSLVLLLASTLTLTLSLGGHPFPLPLPAPTLPPCPHCHYWPGQLPLLPWGGTKMPGS